MQPKTILNWQRRLKAHAKAHAKAHKISMAQLAVLLQLKPRALQRRFAGQTAWSLEEYLRATHLLELPPIYPMNSCF